MTTIVIVGRDDAHTGKFVERLTTVACFNARAFEVRKIPYRFCFVEWNSPQDTHNVASQFVKVVPNSYAYVVGPEWHRHVCDNPNMVIMEFFAKNVAIRRIETPMIVSTNSDVIFGPGCLDVLAANPMWRDQILYRTTLRVDIRADREYLSLSEVTEPGNAVHEYPAGPPQWTQGAGDFQAAMRSWWYTMRGFDETLRFAKIHKDGRLCRHCLALKGRIYAQGKCYHLYHGSSYINLTHNQRTAKTAPFGAPYNAKENIPYKNPDNWGLAGAKETTVAENVVRLVAPAGMQLRKAVPQSITPGPLWKKSCYF